ncbi:hypothetical protein UlMin_010281 [Ulmus minor]
MGKYMRKAKAAGEVAVMEVSQASSLGVRTRAKTLALKRLQKSLAASPAAASSDGYLQLRSRRLEKPPIIVSSHEGKRQRQGAKLGCVQNPRANPKGASRLRVNLGDSGSRGSVSLQPEVKDTMGEEKEVLGSCKNGDLGVEEASFGENVLEFEGRERSTRETTPCSLIRDPDTIQTPGSSTRPMNSEINRKTQSSSQRHIPTANEMDDFFAGAEEEQQKQFIDKYNFDPVKEKPLPGRFEWEKVKS